ncbi:hypothetical protein SAMN04488168_1315 [Bacillus sp. 491mf]|nr:hypothetical protein SAMN04488168_1315 [Bacillus sp. 491mf]
MGVCIKEFVIVNNTGNIFTGDNLRDTSFVASKTFTGSTGPTCMDVVVVIGNTNEVCLRPGDVVTTTITRGTGLTGSSPSSGGGMTDALQGTPSSSGMTGTLQGTPSSSGMTDALQGTPSSSGMTGALQGTPSSSQSNGLSSSPSSKPGGNSGSSCESALLVVNKTDHTDSGVGFS